MPNDDILSKVSKAIIEIFQKFQFTKAYSRPAIYDSTHMALIETRNFVNNFQCTRDRCELRNNVKFI